MQLQKAYFWRMETDGLRPVGSGMRVMFNPTELSLTKASQLAEAAIPGLDTPLQQFVRGQTEKLTVRLFFDTTDEGMGTFVRAVTEETDKFYSLVKITADLHAPPVCAFVWGSGFPGQHLPTDQSQARMWFTGVVESIQQEFTLFSPAGVPLRANLTVTMREYKTLERQAEQLRLQSADRTRSHVVQRADTLSALAGRFYGSPSDWRPIAEQNGIDNPRRLCAGAVLEIPAIDRVVR